MLDLFFQVLILSSHFSLVFFRVGSWSASAALVLETAWRSARPLSTDGSGTSTARDGSGTSPAAIATGAGG